MIAVSASTLDVLTADISAIEQTAAQASLESASSSPDKPERLSQRRYR